MSEILSNTGVKLWAETDYNELWLTVFDQLTGQGGKSNIRLIDEALEGIDKYVEEHPYEYYVNNYKKGRYVIDLYEYEIKNNWTIEEDND